MDLAVATRSYLGDDKSWLGDAMHYDAGLPIELDLSKFDFTTDFPNGFLPSGIVLARITAGGKYGHYDPGTVVNESASIAVDGTSGTWTFALDGESVAGLAFNITAADLLTAIEGLSNVNVGDFTVTGGPGNSGGTTPYVVAATTTGQYADQNMANITDASTDALAGGGADVVVTVTQGGGTGAATGGAGLEIAKGHLLAPVSVTNDQGVVQTSGARPCALFNRGRVREAKLPANHRLDAAAKLALPLIQYLSANGDVT